MSELEDRLRLRELVDAWMMWRDARQWSKVATLWHDGGVMMTTWGGTSTPGEFARAAQEGFERGDRMLHSNGGSTIELTGDRAVVQTKLRIMQRAPVDGVLCDVVCLGRDYDLCERREGRWGFVLRQPIYEQDSLTPVDPSQTLVLDPQRLGRYPEGYARMAYLQEGLGYRVALDMPVHTGPRLEELYAQGESWLAGGDITWALATAVQSGEPPLAP